MSEREPQRFGRYNVVKTLGKGAMGIVYLGEDPVISRRVAIKVIRAHPDLEGTELEERQARFEREFRSAGNLSHPNIVTVYDVGKETNDSFITMEYVQGESLESVLKAGRAFTFKEIARIARQIASALDYAHGEGIVHRDIKPANILMTVDGRPKVTDFGVAKLQTSGMTSTGMIIGTPMYMSPEQITGRDVSGASDQFSLAAMLYELMTGEPPFQGDNPTTIMYQVVHNEPEPPHNLNKSLPEAVDRAVLKGMAKKIEERYQSCTELAEAISRALEEGGVADAVVAGDPEMETVALRADQIVLEDKPAPTREPRPQATPRKNLWIGLAAAAALALLVVGGLSLLGGDGEPAAESAAAEPGVSASIEVLSDPAGAQIFVDGEDVGLVTPAHVPLSGTAGDITQLELRRDGSVLARTQVVMGSAMPSRWQPEVLPAPERWSITSSPAGAAVTVDGEAAGTTPAEHTFAYDRTYDVRLELDGYEPASRTVDLASMDEAAKAGRSLDVSLAKVVPPGELVIRASYPVTVTVDGRQHSGSRVSLPPGRYNVGLAAPQVFYFATQRVEIGSGRATELSLPAATDVSIAATPGNCRIRIDGRDAGIVPLNVKLAVGRHTIDFLWDSIGKSMTVTESVDGSTQRIFRAAPRE
jgi:tRNA A-37 threonylcarbamoyl transferase component Bud32